MKSEQEDKQLRNLFAQLREEDARSSPSFISTWSAALDKEVTSERSPVWTGWLRPLPLGLAATAATATFLFLWVGTEGTSLDSGVGEAAISAWTAPSTSFLGLEASEFLDLSDATLLTSMPVEPFDWDSPTDGLIETAMGELAEERDL